MIDPTIRLVLGFFVGCLLLASGAQKLRERGRLLQVVAAYQLIPRRWLLPACWAVTSAEVLFGAAMVLRAGNMAAGAGAALLLAAYAAAIGINIRRGLAAIQCGCSFRSVSGLSSALVVRNLLLAAMALATLLPVGARHLAGFDVVQSAISAVVLGLIYLSTEALLANSQLRQRSFRG
jgi:hypothetical protein